MRSQAVKSKTKKIAQVVVTTLAVLLVLAVLIPIIPSNQWWIRTFTFPQAQIAALLLILLLIVPFLFSLRRLAGPALMAAMAATLAYQLSYLLPYTPLWAEEIADAGTCPTERRLRILVLNVKEGDVVNPAMFDLVRQTRPDLFLALETEPEWLERTTELNALFDQAIEVPRAGAWGMALYSRLPLIGPEIRYLVEDYVPSIRTGVRLRSGELILFYGLHPKPPAMHDTARGDAELIRAGREIARSDTPTILAGDLNDVPWNTTMQRFKEISGMREPRVGRAFDATFRPDMPLLRWPLDYALASEAFRLSSFDPTRDVGSDHFPVLADYCLDQSAGPRLAAFQRSASGR